MVDDHPLIRMGLEMAFVDAPDIQILAEAGEGEQALELLAESRFDVVVLDISIPGKHGIDVLKCIVERHPGLPVLLYTRFPEDQYAVRALRAGAVGYLTKKSSPEDIIEAIRTTAGGGTYITPLVGQMLNREMQRNRVNLTPEDLSDREFQVFQLIVRGFSTTEIAYDLGLSVKTVSTHRAHVLQKLGLHGTADLVRFALRYGLDEHAPQ
ncbi:MAG: response regulator transcription factor [Gammaproteobacteria bacterium]|nr:response regulator transcription factor [Gammaproteobacteria bacterium]